MQQLLDRIAVEPEVSVGNIMRPVGARIRPDATARQAAAILAYYDTTNLPVVERGDGRVVGVLSASDILHLRTHEERDTGDGAEQPVRSLPDAILDTVRVREIMLPVLFSVEPTASLCELADLIERTGTDRVLVVADGRLCGVVTTTDLLRAYSTTT
jgi:CBS domain-containing protein